MLRLEIDDPRYRWHELSDEPPLNKTVDLLMENDDVTAVNGIARNALKFCARDLPGAMAHGTAKQDTRYIEHNAIKLIMPLNFNIDIKSESVTKLIGAIEHYVDVRHEPKAIVERAKAEAEASLILAKADIQKLELTQRAARRWIATETRHQQNIESIALKAAKELPEKVSQEPVSEDWMAQFFESCQNIGEEELQKLWAKILAGEVTKPRTHTRRLMQVLRAFDSHDAQFFQSICSAAFTVGKWRFIFSEDVTNRILKAETHIEEHLASIGLLGEPDLRILSRINGRRCEYFGTSYEIRAFVEHSGDDLNLDEIIAPGVELRHLTAVGNELATIVSAQPIPGILAAIEQELSAVNFKFVEVKEPPSQPL